MNKLKEFFKARCWFPWGHDYSGTWKSWGYTYQEGICKKCGKIIHKDK